LQVNGHRFAPSGEKRVDFQRLELKTTLNQYLLCPPGMDTRATPHGDSPIFAALAERLLRSWQRVALAQPRVAMVRDDREKGQCDFVQRSFLFRFPDTITIEVIAVDDDTSTFVVYSRSTYGRARSLAAERAGSREL
jgi:hypothetical protein